MDVKLPDAKELKKLANACRKAGIKTFKGAGFEFTLADEAPATAKPRGLPAVKAAVAAPQTEEIPSDAPTGDDLLFWSVSDPSADDEVNNADNAE